MMVVTQHEFESWLEKRVYGSNTWTHKGKGVYWMTFSDKVALSFSSMLKEKENIIRSNSSITMRLVSVLNGRVLSKGENGYNEVLWSIRWRKDLNQCFFSFYSKYDKAPEYYNRVAEIADVDEYVQDWKDKITSYPEWEQHPNLPYYYNRLVSVGYLSVEQEQNVMRTLKDTPIKRTPKIVLIRVLYFLAKTEGNERLMKVCKDYGDALKANPDAKAPPLVKSNLRSRERDIQKVLDKNPRLRT